MTAFTIIKERISSRAATASFITPGYIRYGLALLFSVTANCLILQLLNHNHVPQDRFVFEEDAVELNVIDMDIDMVRDEIPERRESVVSPVAEAMPSPPQLSMPALELASVATDAPALRLPDNHNISQLELSCIVPDVEPMPVPSVASPVIKPSSVIDSHGPTLIDPIDLSGFYPYSARRRGVKGESVIQVVVNEEGKVSSVKLLNSTPAGIFDLAAQRVGKALHFRPAKRNGKTAAACVKMTLEWRLD
ncbi:MAG: energy transducer TonB [Planctomycetes bacterium]|nr:energy transducer TonB [Planctomycetota bacterium]